MLLLALGLAGALAQVPSDHSGAANTGTVVSGHLIEQETRAPIGGAQIMAFPMLQGPPPAGPSSMRAHAVLTDDDGQFVFTDLPDGRYRFIAQKTGFALTPLSAPQTADVQGSQRIDNLELVLERGGVVTGRIVTEAGERQRKQRHGVADRRPSVGPLTSVLANSLCRGSSHAELVWVSHLSVHWAGGRQPLGPSEIGYSLRVRRVLAPDPILPLRFSIILEYGGLIP